MRLRKFVRPFEKAFEKVQKENPISENEEWLVMLSNTTDEKILEWAKKTIKEDLSVHQLEELLKNEIKPTKKSKKSKDIYLVDLESSIGDKLKADVELTKHKLTISYKDSQDLNRILEILNLLEEGL